MYAYYRVWRIMGMWERLHALLCEQVRNQARRAPTQGAAIVDSQSATTTECGSPHDYNDAKKLSRRKGLVLVDPLGWVLGVT